MTTYTVVAQRSDGWWAFSIPAIRGAHGQARRLDQVPAEASDVISLMLDIDDDAFEVTVDVHLEAPLESLVAEARAARRRLDESQREAQERLHLAAAELHEQGLSMRDIGSGLNLSFQRVHQILEAGGGLPPRPLLPPLLPMLLLLRLRLLLSRHFPLSLRPHSSSRLLLSLRLLLSFRVLLLLRLLLSLDLLLSRGLLLLLRLLLSQGLLFSGSLLRGR